MIKDIEFQVEQEASSRNDEVLAIVLKSLSDVQLKTDLDSDYGLCMHSKLFRRHYQIEKEINTCGNKKLRSRLRRENNRLLNHIDIYPACWKCSGCNPPTGWELD